MRNKLSFDLQLSARKAAIAERIAAHKIARSKVSVFLMAMSAGVFMAIGFTFYLSVIADAPSSQALTHLVGGLCFTLGFILLAVLPTVWPIPIRLKMHWGLRCRNEHILFARFCWKSNGYTVICLTLASPAISLVLIPALCNFSACGKSR